MVLLPQLFCLGSELAIAEVLLDALASRLKLTVVPWQHCFAHDTDNDDVEWGELVLRVYVCDRLSFRTRLVFQEGLTDGFNFEGCCMATRDDRSHCLEYHLEASLDEDSVPLMNGPDAPLVGTLLLTFRCYFEEHDESYFVWERMTNADLAAMLARVTEADQTRQRS